MNDSIHISTTTSLVTALSIALFGAIGGCSEDDSGGTRPAAATVVSSFDAASYELAEGLTVRGGHAYTGFAPLGRIDEIDPDGTVRTYANVPAGGTNGYTLGLAFDPDGVLYVAQTLNVPGSAAPAPGIYAIPPSAVGTTVMAPFATDPEMVFPNGLAFAANGELLVTDSAAGKIFAITRDGTVRTWSNAPELTGSGACAAPLPFPIGVNGIVATASHVYVTNTSTGALLDIDVGSDGAAGATHVIVRDCGLAGFDGLARDADGSFLVAQNGAPGRLVRVSPTDVVTPLATEDTLDGPASVALTDWNGARTALVTSSAFFSAGTAGATPHPSLVSFGPL